MKWLILGVGSVAAIGVGIVILRNMQLRERADKVLRDAGLKGAASGTIAPDDTVAIAADAGATRSLSETLPTGFGGLTP